jgi:hypothetical protein
VAVNRKWEDRMRIAFVKADKRKVEELAVRYLAGEVQGNILDLAD